jgi:hypothetical protein
MASCYCELAHLSPILPHLLIFRFLPLAVPTGSCIIPFFESHVEIFTTRLDKRTTLGSDPSAAAGAAVVGGAYAIGTVFTANAYASLPCTSTTVLVSGITYYYCGTTWYQPAYPGGNVTYIVVNPPRDTEASRK